MRASAMLHLPGLVMSDQMNKIINSVNKIGLAVRGLHGEGTEAMGNVFQVSNQITLGEAEEEIIERLNKVIETDHRTRAKRPPAVAAAQAVTLLDQIGRAYGILSHAHSISSKEALNLLSVMKLGIDLGLFPELIASRWMSYLSKPSRRTCRKGAQAQKMTAEERDALRATLIRAKLKGVPEPDTAKIATKPSGSQENDE